MTDTEIKKTDTTATAVTKDETAKPKVIETVNVFYSDNEIPYGVLPALKGLYKSTKYPIVLEAPDPSLQKPKYNWTTLSWEEHAEEEQAELINDAKQELKNVRQQISDAKQGLESLKQEILQAKEDLISIKSDFKATQLNQAQMSGIVAQLIAAATPTKTTTTTDGGTK